MHKRIVSYWWKPVSGHKRIFAPPRVHASTAHPSSRDLALRVKARSKRRRSSDQMRSKRRQAELPARIIKPSTTLPQDTSRMSEKPIRPLSDRRAEVNVFLAPAHNPA
jgi:hypothetical protein